MGPSSRRIIEKLTLDLDVKKGSRILDLGCGKALTSVYLAMKEVDSDDKSKEEESTREKTNLIKFNRFTKKWNGTFDFLGLRKLILSTRRHK